LCERLCLWRLRSPTALERQRFASCGVELARTPEEEGTFVVVAGEPGDTLGAPAEPGDTTGAQVEPSDAVGALGGVTTATPSASSISGVSQRDSPK
jgi:hypothetical protein